MLPLPMPYSLMIARFPGQNQEHPASAGYVINLMETLHNDDRVATIHPWSLSDTPITMSRNRCIKEALAKRLDYVLMIDSDMSPDCEAGAPPFWETAWEFMMERRSEEERYRQGIRDILGKHELAPNESNIVAEARKQFPSATIAAPYCGPPPVEHVYVFRWAEKEGQTADPNFKLEMIDRDDAARRTGIEEVAALPTGLILYDTRVFAQLPAPWFDYEWADEPFRTIKASTEDVFQTRNASLMGLPQYCTWDCWAGHIKTKVVCKPQPLTIQTMRNEFADAILRARSSA